MALGLSGSEARFGCEPFAPHFAEAERCGLRRVAHAGEHAGPESVRAVLALGAERVGHGVRSVEDPELLAELAADRVPLEVCPTSNLLLGVAADLRSHPLSRLREAGVEVSIHSDDPALFGTDLPAELERLHAGLGWSAEHSPPWRSPPSATPSCHRRSGRSGSASCAAAPRSSASSISVDRCGSRVDRRSVRSVAERASRQGGAAGGE